MTSIKKLGNLCKKEKTVYLYNTADGNGCVRQWVGCRSAIYPMDGMPEMTMEQLMAVMDIEPEKAEKFLTEEAAVMPVEQEDILPQDEPVHIGSVQIIMGDKLLVMLWSDRGGTWMFWDALKTPVRKWDQALIRHGEGNDWIVLRHGLYIEALLRPIARVRPGQAEDASRIARLCREIQVEETD